MRAGNRSSNTINTLSRSMESALPVSAMTYTMRGRDAHNSVQVPPERPAFLCTTESNITGTQSMTDDQTSYQTSLEGRVTDQDASGGHEGSSQHGEPQVPQRLDPINSDTPTTTQAIADAASGCARWP